MIAGEDNPLSGREPVDGAPPSYDGLDSVNAEDYLPFSQPRLKARATQTDRNAGTACPAKSNFPAPGPRQGGRAGPCR